MAPSLFTGFHRSAERFPDRPALHVEDEVLTYATAAERVRRLAGALAAHAPADAPLIGVLANRSTTAYLGVLATLASGRGYVPFNPKHPVERLRRVRAASGVTVLIVGPEGTALAGALLAGEPPVVLLAPASRAADLGVGPPHLVLDRDALATAPPADPILDVADDGLAYLLFTSGSTGEPKGVAVSHANVRRYARTIVERFHVRGTDRFSQMSDLSFDWSVHDLYPCWEAGACLCAIPERSHMAPAKLIRSLGITMWAAVPSSVGVMAGMRMLRPGAFPDIRVSVFCGEPLPAAYAEAWQAAAPHAIVENLYGPTEATVAITGYRWHAATSPTDCRDGIVPIGWPFPEQACVVVDDELQAVPAEEAGELCLGGSQVALGYWGRPNETAARFVQLPGQPGRWYRTGDLVRQARNGCLYYLGRIDDQVKIRGYRVELQEVDHVVRAVVGEAMVATVAWPAAAGSAEGVVTFVSGAHRAAEPILAACRARLPDYMVPRAIVFIEAMPLSSNGKVDRRRLQDMLQQRKDG
jgi:amino acid adenylation domain-containing protein